MIAASFFESFQPQPEIVKVRVSGKVQGVGYRRWLHKKATAKGLTGWVRNVVDGSVEAILAGPAEAVEEVVNSMKTGPSRASVDFVRVRPIRATTNVSGFRIRKTFGVASNGAVGSKAEKLFSQVHQQLLTKNSNNPLSITPEGERYWRDGFLADKIRLYDTSRYSLSCYLSDIQREMTRLINGHARWLINDKLAFELAFGNVVSIPNTVLSVEASCVSCPYESGVIPPGEFFAKPITSGGGTGVFPVSFDGRHVTFGGRRAPWADFIDYLKSLGKRYLLCRKAEQHHKLAGIYPASTNTVRVLMLRQPQT